VSFQKTFVVRTLLFGVLTLFVTSLCIAQSSTPAPMMELKMQAKRRLDVATGNNLYCAGLIQTTPIDTDKFIVGAHNEADTFQFAQNDYLYINGGRNQNVSVGDTFAVVRPRGEVTSKWTNKDYLGFFVQEVGALEVVNVKNDVSVVIVKTSCDTILIGDLIQPTQRRWSPPHTVTPVLNRFGDPSGKQTGRVIMARDLADLITRDFIVYVDLGGEDDLHVGDKLTIFRELHAGNVTTHSQKENLTSRDYGFESFRYRGGKFSNQSGRKKGERAYGNEVTSKWAKAQRPPDLRKVVGEAVVLNVRERTSTVVITKTGQEIHPGDWVELQ
jgi:hypothetical protein